ncbi:hypothetical protein MNBD_GAMMA20-2473 [hydrothermal vent metagenome]|uniref:EamA domain-containing protein n=1 Tax=hydrothermal vent metagenome TaxID=652676 RepID=A0A3B1ABB6_9ZZZZ
MTSGISPPPAPANGLPVAALLFAASFWGCIWYPLRELEAAGLGGLWATWAIFIAATLVGGALAWPRRHELLRHPGLLLLLALAGGWMNTAFVLALLDGNVLRVLLLFYLSPLWSTLLGWWWLGERPSRAGLLTLALATLGATVMLWNPQLGLPWPQGWADWLALSAGLTFSLSNVLLRRLQHLSEPPRVFVGVAGVVVVAGVWLLLSGVDVPQVAPSVWSGAVLLGGVGVILAGLAVVYGVSHMPVHRSAVIMLFELVAGVVSSQLLTDEVVTGLEWLGGGLIVLGAYWSARSGGKTGRNEGAVT